MFIVSGSLRRILNSSRWIKPNFLDQLCSDILAEMECPEILGSKILLSEIVSELFTSRKCWQTLFWV